jgi:hypothetical protein
MALRPMTRVVSVYHSTGSPCRSRSHLRNQEEAWALSCSEAKGPLTVTLDDFSRILGDDIERVDLGKFVAEIGYLVIEVLLVWLATEPEEHRKLLLGTLTDAEEATLVSLVQRFYLSRPEFVRQSSVREPLKLLQQAWHARARLWFGSRWDTVSTLVATIAQTIGNKIAGTDANIEHGLSALLKAEPTQWSNADFARAILCRFVDVSRVFGFSGVTVLVDKVDETVHTNNSSTATAKLLYPLLVNTQILEIEGLSWLFFLWDKLRDEYAGDVYPVRLDKIPNTVISWDNRFLVDLTERRLAHFSHSKVSEFSGLCEISVPIEATFEDIVRLSMRSPRELIRVFDTIIREHDEEFALLDSPPRLQKVSIDRGLDKYSIEALRRSFQREHLQQISRLRMVTFINKDVQQAFRINDQSARNRIRAWTDAGIVSQTGTRQAEGGGAGKPSHEFSVTDFRARRLLDRNLQLGQDFDLVDPQAD